MELIKSMDFVRIVDDCLRIDFVGEDDLRLNYAISGDKD